MINHTECQSSIIFINCTPFLNMDGGDKPLWESILYHFINCTIYLLISLSSCVSNCLLYSLLPVRSAHQWLYSRLATWRPTRMAVLSWPSNSVKATQAAATAEWWKWCRASRWLWTHTDVTLKWQKMCLVLIVLFMIIVIYVVHEVFFFMKFSLISDCKWFHYMKFSLIGLFFCVYSYCKIHFCCMKFSLIGSDHENSENVIEWIFSFVLNKENFNFTLYSKGATFFSKCTFFKILIQDPQPTQKS